MTDKFADELRHAFEERAARVGTSPDALVTIRRRIGSARRRRGLWTVAVAGLATSAAAGVAAVVLTLPWSAPPPSGVSSPGPAGPRVPVYVVGSVAGRPMLYLEERPYSGNQRSPDERIKAALTDMITGRPLDPDHHSGWPATATVQSVQTSGG